MKIYLAGFYSRPYLITQFKPKYVLESYWYAKDSPEFMKNIKQENTNFLLDSGAFTFLNQKKQISWNNYVKEYIDFINNHEIQNFFELDIYKIVGVQKTEEIRKLIETETKKRCIPVWHRHLGLNYLENLSSNYNKIGFGGFVINDIKTKDYKYVPKLLNIAKKNNCNVHGLGFTSFKHLNYNDFDSVDSTSWLSGSRYGTVYCFNYNKLCQYKKQKNQKTKNYKILDEQNIKEWIKFQKYAEHNL